MNMTTVALLIVGLVGLVLVLRLRAIQFGPLELPPPGRQGRLQRMPQESQREHELPTAAEAQPNLDPPGGLALHDNTRGTGKTTARRKPGAKRKT